MCRVLQVWALCSCFLCATKIRDSGEVCKCRICNKSMPHEWPSLFLWMFHLPKLNHSHLFSLPLSKDIYFNWGFCLFISSTLKSLILKQHCCCPGLTSKPGVPLQFSPIARHLWYHLCIEPKQNIDFSGVSHDLHLCNKFVSATNIHFSLQFNGNTVLHMGIILLGF